MAKRVCLRGAVVLATLGITAVDAQVYPAKTVRFVITYPAGGGSDYTARPIAQRLTERWGQPVVLEARSGGSAMIGTDFVVKSPADGYTLLLSASSEVSMNTVLFKKMPYDPVRDLLPITLVGTTSPVLLAHPSLPAKNVKELVALARAKPGALSYASIGNGTPQHFAGELMKTTFNIDMVHVPYKGAAPALIDLAGGHVPIGLTAPTTAIPLIKSGRLRVLAVTSAQRSGALPDVPTIAEAGAPGFDIVQWYGIWVAAKTPKDIFGRAPYDAVNDFAAISQLSSVPMALSIHPSLPARTVRELLALAQAKPGTLNYGSAGIGSNSHITGELFNLLAKTRIQPVHFKGGGPSIVALVSGEVHVGFSNVPETSRMVQAGRLRALAVSTGKRTAAMPDVPTNAEAGLPGFDFSGWHGLFAPSATPPRIIATLNEKMRSAVAAPGEVKRFEERGIEVITNTPEAFAAYLKSEVVRWTGVIRERNIKAE